MISIVRGPAAAVATSALLAGDDGLTFRVVYNTPYAIPWCGSRLLLATLRQRLGNVAVDKAIEPHRAVLSLVLRGLDGALTDDERRRRELHRAQQLGFLSHNPMVYRGLYDAWAELFAALMPAGDVRIVIPFAHALDPETLGVFRAVLTRSVEANTAGPSMAFGVAAHAVTASNRRTLAHIAALERLADTVVHTPGKPGNAQPVATVSLGQLAFDVTDDCLEVHAWTRLSDAPGPLSFDTCSLVLRAARASFDSFSFVAARQLGLELYRRSPDLPAQEMAELHRVIALSAYNVQVATDAGSDLAELLEHHFGEALALETDPAQQSHLLYRLCINSGRRKGDLRAGLEFGTRAVQVARDPDIAPGMSAYLEAWARNGRAYVYARLGQLDAATADAEAAFELLATGASQTGAPVNEVAESSRVVVDNLATLALMAGDSARAMHWQQIMSAAEDDSMMRISPHRWILLHRNSHDLAQAITWARVGMDDARRFLRPLAEDRYAADLGDLYYRVGDAVSSYEHFALCLKIRRRIGEPGDVLRTEISCAVAASRAGLFAAAEQRFEQATKSPLADGPAVRAEMLGAMAVLAARQSDGARAEQLVDEAIECAVDSGSRDVLLRVAQAAGEACLALGRTSDAREAFARGRDVLEPEHDDVDAAASADVLGIFIGALVCGADDDDLRVLALVAASRSLDDAETWWQLPRLIPELEILLARDESVSEEVRRAASTIAVAARQRVDCRAALRSALARL